MATTKAIISFTLGNWTALKPVICANVSKLDVHLDVIKGKEESKFLTVVVQ